MSKTGRFYIRSKTGKLYVIEPIDNSNKDGNWGNQVGNKLEKVTAKFKGAVKDSESIITEENGFENIVTLKPGESPLEYIERLEYKK